MNKSPKPNNDNFWDERYGHDTYFYGTEPNIWFKEQLDFLQPGKILLPAEGEGRNAVYAAGTGWLVTAFDMSQEGRKKALKLANARHLHLDYQVCRAENFICDPESFDAVAMIYTHFPTHEQAALINQLQQALKTGGVFLMEVFSVNQIKNNSGGPKRIDLLYKIENIKIYFSSLRIDFLKEVQFDLDEGPRHSGKADVIRLRAIK